MKRIIETAKEQMAFYLAHGFECWMIGDVLGMHIAWRGARRCEHVIRLATALESK